MAVKKLKPITPGQRHRIKLSYDTITSSNPEKSLIKKSSDFPNLFSEKFQKIRSVRTGFYAADVLEFSK